MLGLMNQQVGDTFVVLSLSRVELRSAIRRRCRAGDLDNATANVLLADFDQHIENTFLVKPVTEAVIDTAVALLDRHELKAYDSLQLAGCLAQLGQVGAEPPTFVTSDKQLVRAAQAEGLRVFDPTVG